MNQQLGLHMVKLVPGGAITAAVRTNPVEMFRSMLTGELLLAGTKDLLKTASAGIVMSALSFEALLEWKFALQNFDRDVFTPAMKKADEECKKKVGL